MFEELEFQGYWHIPQHPDDSVPGMLKYSRSEGIVLELLGLFGNYKDKEEFHKLDIICGFSKEGKKITLVDSFCINSTSYNPGMNVSSYVSNKLFLNVWINSLDDIKIEEAKIEFTDIDKWVGIGGFDFDDTTENNTIKSTYKLPDKIQLCKSDIFEISIEFYLKNYNIDFDFQKDLSLEQSVKLVIIFYKPVALKDFESFYRILQNFFSLLVTQPVYPRKIEFRCDSIVEAKNNYNRIGQLIEYCYDIPSVVKTIKNLQGRNMILRLKDNKVKAGLLLLNWIEKAEILQPVMDLFFGTIYNDNLFTNNIFLNYIQGIETYHRRIHGGTDLPEEEHNERITFIINSINDENQKKWLSEKLQYSNDITLRKRLKYLFEKFEKIIGDYKTLGLINKIVNTRNYLTHFGNYKKEDLFEGVSLYYAAMFNKMLLLVILFSEMGVTENDLEKIFGKNSKYGSDLMFYKRKLDISQ